MDLDQLRYYTSWHHHANKVVYDAPAPPWKPLHVHPTAIEDYTNEIPLNWGVGRVKAGDWDKPAHRHPLRETTIYRGLRQRFESGYDWEETALYERAKAEFEDGNRVRGYESIEDYRQIRCEYLDDLFESIKTNGYRPNNTTTHNSATAQNPFENAYVHHLEPLVVIGREGNIYLAEGFHRTIIASILDLDEIPVNVLCRHERWQRNRDKISRSSNSIQPMALGIPSDHPDLQDIGVSPQR